MTNGGQGAILDDSSRAAQNANYKITKKQLIDVIEAYRQRKYVEDIDYIKNELNGIDSVLEALDVTEEAGISATSLESRTAVFGTHHKDPPV